MINDSTDFYTMVVRKYSNSNILPGIFKMRKRQLRIKEYKQIILQRLAKEYEIEYRRNRNYMDIADMFKLCDLGFLNRGDGKVIVFINEQVKHIRNIKKRR